MTNVGSRLCVFIMLFWSLHVRGNDDVEVLRDAYSQNRAYFTPISLSSRWEWQRSDLFMRSIGFEREYALGALSDRSARNELLTMLKAGGKDVTEENLESFVLSRLEGELLEPITKEYLLSLGPIYELRVLGASEKRKKAAETLGVASFTGGEFSIIQSPDSGQSWRCLEPYPLTGHDNPIYWEKESALKVEALLPPFFQIPNTAPIINEALTEFWAADQITSIWEQDECFLIAASSRSSDVMVASFNSSDAPFPKWICNIKERPDKEGLSGLVGMINEFSTESAFAIPPNVPVPTYVVYYKTQDFGEGTYPISILRVSLGRVRTSDTRHAQPLDLPFGWTEIERLTISNLRYGDDARLAEPLSVPENASVFDFDTGEGYVQGEDTDSALTRILNRNFVSSSRLIWLNAIILLVLVAALLWKFKK